ncbi:sulfurtransferase complex subunit TusD [Algibacillus agarilyticus]|uniref:sulfurtransferase complex subunit TusD n=1 Tax=Algibacillus agarilyticus TaxID=2234133 RepID=UPI000DD00288|nr:sulfurtransferase complex subunit TusD [Algibacillus agarilyticus]
MSTFLLFITSPPSSQAALSAIKFAHAAISNHHQISAVFFYGDGVNNANALQAPPSDETNIPHEWQSIALKHNTQLLVCSAAAQRKGVLTPSEADYHGLQGHNLAAPFEIAGLGEYVQLQTQVTQVVQF